MNEQEKYDWMVYVSCMTFNQASYIVDAMNGFTMQDTTFPFVCAIVDDASTDGEQGVIKNFFNEHFDLEDKNIVRHEETDDYVLMFARHKTNLNCYFAVIYLKYNHYSIKKSKTPYISQWRDNAKYIALCEGDDYWIAADKLQKQVILLEKNQNCVLTYTSTEVVNEKGKKLIVRNSKVYSGNCLKQLIRKGNFISTVSVCYRSEAEKGWEEVKNSIPFPVMMGDKQLWIYLSSKGVFEYIPKPMVCYRILKVSASHSPEINKGIEFLNNGEEISIYFNNLYNVGVPEHYIRKKYSASRIRHALKYSWCDVWTVASHEFRLFPSNFLNVSILLLFFLRIVGIKRK